MTTNSRSLAAPSSSGILETMALALGFLLVFVSGVATGLYLGRDT
jgi:hypothetical protein